MLMEQLVLTGEGHKVRSKPVEKMEEQEEQKKSSEWYSEYALQSAAKNRKCIQYLRYWMHFSDAIPGILERV